MKLKLLILNYSLLILFVAGCDRRDLTYDYHPFCDVRVEVDWSHFHERPTGMTLMCYPEDGGAPVTHTTNSVDSTTVSLREGRYRILVYNQSPYEFGTIGFRDMDRFGTALAHAIEAPSRWYTRQEATEMVAHQPEPLALARREGFEVTPDMIHRSNQLRVEAQKAQQQKGRAPQPRDTRATVSLGPQNSITAVTVRVRVHGIHNLLSVRAGIRGMADGYFMGPGTPAEGKVTHLLEEWAIEHDADDYTKGFITTRYSSFGLAGTPAREDLTLALSLLLVDNRTVRDTTYHVGDRIERMEDGEGAIGEVRLHLDVGVSREEGGGDGDRPPGGEDDPADRPVELPEVKPEGGSAGGFDATVDEWDEEEDIEIVL